jgi:hypothetical protein
MRVMKVLLVLALSVAALVIPSAVRAQVGSSTDIITGTVRGPDGHPIAGARVEVTSVELETKRFKTTDDKGRYTILFPDGGGQYLVTIRFLGMQPANFTLVRQADEDRLVGDVTMSASPTTLATVVVRAQQTPPRGDRPEPGSTERMMTGEQLARLPIDPSDPNAIAALVPGVVSIAGTDSTSASFSVAGQRLDQNQVTLDGLTFGAGTIPQEAVRTTRVITNTFDIARGQFTGGQIATTTRGGTNRISGSINYALRDPHLEFTDDQGSANSFSGGYTQHQLSGGVGGPIVPNRAFWFGSVQVRRRTDPIRSLLTADPRTLTAFGTLDDSTRHFLQLLEGYGIPSTVSDIPDARLADNASAIVRFDWQVTDDHSLMLRGNWNGSLQRGSRISTLTVPTHGGESASSGGGAMLTLSSVLGSYLNEFRGYYSRGLSNSDPYITSPEGRVQVASELAGGNIGVSSLDFGGNTGLPNDRGDHQVEVSDELSWLSPGGAHRWKLGGLISTSDFAQTTGTNLMGSFAFNSLEDFANNTPTAFTRSLSGNKRTGGSATGAIYFGDTWRFSRAFQLTYGARAEGSRFPDRPAYNPAVENLFGRRTDQFPNDFHVSPRAGFSWSLGFPERRQATGGEEQGQRGGAPGAGGGFGGRGGGRGGGGGGFGRGGNPFGQQNAGFAKWVLRGGLGEFRGRSPTQLFSAALDATGLPSGQQQLVCIGDAVPLPNWPGYLADPSSVPTSCADGSVSGPQSSIQPNVTLISQDFAAPRTWRGSFGVTRRIGTRFGLTMDASYALGTHLYGVRDLNFDPTPQFTLIDEADRPVFVPVASIVPRSGATTLAASRLHPELGYVFDVDSRLESRSLQLTTTLTGTSFRSLLWSVSYTRQRSRDQSSFSGGSALGGFSSGTTAGNPNDLTWTASDFERPHAFTGSLTWLARPWLDVTSFLRVSAGAPFTPRVSGDINGDGARNDRAFVYTPEAAIQFDDTALANGMSRLLASAPSRVRDCLEVQENVVADRNSCRGPWTTSLDFQANLRPNLPRLGRRLQLAVSFLNPLAGLDQLLHGSDDLRGWGQNAFSDPTLLYVRGFDPGRKRYLYQVNERFGSNATARSAIRQPFQIGFTARLQVGTDRQREMLQNMIRGGNGGADRFNLRNIVSRVAPDPIEPILARADSLKLSEKQKFALRLISDSLRVQVDSMVAVLQDTVAKIAEGSSDFASVFPKIQPKLQEVRTMYLLALQSAQKVLTEEQWAKLPELVRNPTMRRGPGGGAGSGGRRRPPGG